VLDQEFHLVGKDPPVGQDQVLRLVRHVGRVQLAPGQFTTDDLLLNRVPNVSRSKFYRLVKP
jgi:hypothetical protein